MSFPVESLKSKNRLISNFLSLSSMQIANYLVPLINVPYLVRVLGPEKFGLIAFAQAFIQYFILITDYGFNLSATRDISIVRDNKAEVSDIFSAVMVIKTGLMLMSFLALSLLVLSITKFRMEWQIYFLTFGLVVGNVLFPSWLFQGMEKMTLVATLNVLSKTIFTLSVFLFIRSRNDYVYVPGLYSLGLIVAGLVSFWLLINRLGVRPVIPTRRQIIRELKGGWNIFVSTIAISLYTISNPFILGLFTNNTIVGYYSAGEKVVRAAQGLLMSLSQTVYPHISTLASQSREAAMDFIRRLFKMFVAPFFLISLCLFFFASILSNLLLGEQFANSIPVIRILSFIVVIIFVSNLLGIQVMCNLNYESKLKTILIIGGVVNIALLLSLTPRLQQTGAAWAVLLSETYIMVHQFIFLQRRGLGLVTSESALSRSLLAIIHFARLCR